MWSDEEEESDLEKEADDHEGSELDEPEGDVYEVEYYLVKDEEKSSLMRRLWPNPDEVSTPGGILSVIAEDVNSFVVRYFDGEQWQMEWPIESRRLPAMVRVNIASGQMEQQKVVCNYR